MIGGDIMAEEKKKKKKSDNVTVNLPKARASLKRQREMGQLKGNYEDAWKAAGYVAIFLLILFVLLGGINQKKAWEWFKKLGYNIGHTVSSWINVDVEATDDGIYIDPSKPLIDDSTAETSEETAPIDEENGEETDDSNENTDNTDVDETNSE